METFRFQIPPSPVINVYLKNLHRLNVTLIVCVLPFVGFELLSMLTKVYAYFLNNFRLVSNLSPSLQHIKTLEKWPTYRILGGS